MPRPLWSSARRHFSHRAGPGAARAQEPAVSIRGDPVEREARRDRLFSAPAAAESETAGRRIADQIWLFWFEAPGAEAARLMREALERRGMLDLATALRLLDALVAVAPGWAEAWNQRATIRFLTDNYEGSLADIERVPPVEPKHFGALSGQAMIYVRLGRTEEAQAVLRQAVKINPFLSERAVLMQPPGKDIYASESALASVRPRVLKELSLFQRNRARASSRAPPALRPMASVLSHPCASGLRFRRPKRLFGFDGAACADLSSPPGLASLRAVGLPPATAFPTMPESAERK